MRREEIISIKKIQTGRREIVTVIPYQATRARLEAYAFFPSFRQNGRPRRISSVKRENELEPEKYSIVGTTKVRARRAKSLKLKEN